MKFGKIDSLEQIDFSLPNDTLRTNKLFEKIEKSGQKPILYLGCTGWSEKTWVGEVYPAGTKTNEYLYYYSRQFNTIELNTTHYRIPDATTIQKWYAESANDFKFCPKIPQSISHSRDLGTSSMRIGVFCQAIEGLREKLGACFLQVPPYFDTSRLPILEKFIDKFPAQIPIFIELRHESWFTDVDKMDRLCTVLEQKGFGLLLTDVAGRRDVLHMNLNLDATMIRFVGNDLHSSDYTRLNEWKLRIMNWFNKGLKEIYFFTHEPDNIQAPLIAKYFSELFLTEEITVKVPVFYNNDKKTTQMSLF